MEKHVYAGIQLTALAAFLSSYGGSNLALPSFALAALGTGLTAYGIIE